MNSKTMISVLVILTALQSCRHQERLVEAKDRDLTVQVMHLEADPGESGDSYQARVIPDKALLSGRSREMDNGLFYRMDSSFYRMDRGQKEYPRLVQPIANGVSGSYEYLLEFESTREKDQPLQIIYQDRYINHKTYKLQSIKE